ncbi:MAG: phage tail protein [Methylococcaceae bacterium]|jgi:hypothetical protein
MSTYFTLLTATGASAMAASAVSGTPVVLTQVALGDGNGAVPTPTINTTALVHEVYRANITSIVQDTTNPAWFIVELALPPAVGGFYIREFRIDDAYGNAIYVGNCAPEFKPVLADGMTRDSVYRLIVETSNSATINLSIDASITMASREYVDNAINVLDYKQSVRVATTANTALSGLLTIDGVALVAGNRVLVKDNTAASQNGIYTAATGTWLRSTDANTSAKVTAGMLVIVEEGTSYKDTIWLLATNNPITLNSTALTFQQVSGEYVSQAEAEAGISEQLRGWSALRVKQAIEASILQQQPGDLKQFAEYPLPAGWLEMGPKNVSRVTYANLFAKIGTRYGVGDSSTTFGLPTAYSGIDDFVPSSTVIPSVLFDHTITELADGRFIIIGGINATTVQSATYIGTWNASHSGITWVSSTAYPLVIREPTTTLLPDGRIMVVGGYQDPATITAVANVYFGTISGNTITWAAGTAYPIVVCEHTASILDDGRVLITGGRSSSGNVVSNSYFGTISGNTITWAAGTSLPNSIRYDHTVNFLPSPDGRIVLIGGQPAGSAGVTSLSEVYFGSISANVITWVQTTDYPSPIEKHTCTVLPDGRILVIGGSLNATSATAASNCFMGRFSKGGGNIYWDRSLHAPKDISNHAAVYADGKIVITGGTDSSSTVLSSTYFVTKLFNGIKT